MSRFRTLFSISLLLLLTACSSTGSFSSGEANIDGMLDPDDPHFQIHFSAPMDEESVKNAARITPNVPLKFRWHENSLIVFINGDLIPGQRYDFYISDQARSQKGNPLRGFHNVYLAPPLSVEYVEHSDSLERSIFDLIFNYPVDQEQIARALTIEPAFAYELDWVDQHEVQIVPQETLGFEESFEVYLSRRARDVHGVRFLSSHEWTYTTPALEIASRSSSFNQEEATWDFLMKFNQPIDLEIMEVGFDVSPPLALTHSWNSQTTELTLSTDEQLESSTDYTFNISITSTEANPHPFDAILLEREFSSPAITAKANWSNTQTSRTPDLNLAFNYVMDTQSVEQALSFSPSFSFDIVWNDVATEATITPAEPLPQNSTITALLTTEAADSQGGQLRNQRTIALETLETTVKLSVPSEYDRDNPFHLEFSIPMDPDSVQAQLVTEPAFEYELVWSVNNKVAEIVPSQDLYAGTDYSMRFQQAPLDAEGYPFEGRQVFSWTTPSPVVEIFPWRYGLELEEPVEVLFTRAMDPASITPFLRIEPNIDLTYRWDSDNKLILEPVSGLWFPHTTYRLFLPEEARYADGQPVVQDELAINFSTQYSSPLVTFGEEGSNVQVLDASGRRAIQFGGSSNSENNVIIQLHQLTIDQYLELYFQYRPGSFYYSRQHAPYELSNTAFVGQWELVPSRPIDSTHEIFIPDEVPIGIYVISALAQDIVQDQLLLVLTDTTIAGKYGRLQGGGGQVTAWVNNINDFVMSQTRISVFDRHGQILTTGETNSQGIFQGKIPEGTFAELIVARRAGDISITHLNGREWDTRGANPRRSVPAKYFSFIYTDRPIYQPGQLVNFKAIVRLDNDADYRLPFADLDVTLNVRDARGNIVQSEAASLNRFGTVNSSFTIAEGAMLGDYEVELLIEEESFSQYFKVQEYKKPDISIQITSDAENYLLNDVATFEINLQYLFGEPVPNATVNVKWYELRSCYYCRLEPDFSEASNYIWEPSNIENTLTTDSNGYVSYSRSVRMGSEARDYDYLLSTLWGVEVTADDGSDQFVSTFTTIRVFRQDMSIAIKTDRYLYEPGNPVPVTVILDPIFDISLLDHTVKLNLSRWRHESRDYVTMGTHVLNADTGGVVDLDLGPLGNGFYRMEAYAADGQGKRIDTTRYFYVHDFASPWYSDFDGTLDVKVELDQYAQGDTARVIIESSFDGQALLTIERGTVLEERLINIESPFTLLELPVDARFAPNVYVVVQAWQAQDTTPGMSSSYYYGTPADSRLVVAYARLDVPDTQNELTIEITPDQESYAPREDANFTLRVTDYQGEPVEAELSLALVDEAIFLLADDPAGPIHDSFYRLRRLGVYWYDSMSPWRILYAGGRGGGGDVGSPNVVPRSDFPDTVVWLPTVITDVNGEATLDITLPDTLTSWRLTARAVNQAAAVGDHEINVLTQKPVVVRPLPPSSLVEGDQLTFSAIVHNFTEEESEFTVTASSPGLVINGDPDQIITLAPGELQVIVWQASANASGEIPVLVSATSDVGRDDVEMGIPIAPMAIQTVSAEAGSFTGSLTTQIEVPDNLHELSTVSIELNSSIAGSVLAGVEYLTGYPYGCVEQVMSRALPNAVVGRAFESLGYSDRQMSAGLDEKIDASVQRLYAFQHDDGGWGWWYDDRTDAFQTAWVLFGLTTTSRAGYTVDPNVIGNGVEWLSEHLIEMDPRTRAYALYSMALAGQGDLEATQTLAEQNANLDAFAQATLVVALDLLDDKQGARELWQQVEAQVQTRNDDQAFWGLGNMDGYFRSKTMASNVRTSAMVLLAMLQVDPDNQYREATVNWLMDQRQTYGWGTTNETSFAILALTDYLLYSRLSAVGSEFSVFVDGQAIGSGQFDAENISHSIQLPLTQFDPGTYDIRLLGDPNVNLYYQVTGDLYLAQESIEADGIPITRRYLKPSTRRSLETIEEGQLVLVQITVEVPDDAWYVMLEDFLPGGLEALNEGLNTTSHEVVAGLSDDYYDYDPGFALRWFFWEDYGYNFKEVRHDRVIFFVTNPRPGLRTYEYIARAVTAGDFLARPAQFSAMYDPLIWGYSNSGTLTILAE